MSSCGSSRPCTVGNQRQGHGRGTLVVVAAVLGFIWTVSDPCLFKRVAEAVYIIAYFHDLRIVGDSRSAVLRYVKLSKEQLFCMDLGWFPPDRPISFVGREICHHGNSCPIWSGAKYVNKIIITLGLEDSAATWTTGARFKKTITSMAQLTTGVRPTVVSRSSDHARVRFNGSQASGQSLSSQPRTCAAREQGHAFSMAEAQALGQLPEDNHMSSHVQAGALVSITQFNRRSRGRSLGRMAAFT